MTKTMLKATVSHMALRVGMAAWKGKRGPNTVMPPKPDLDAPPSPSPLS